MMQTRVSRSLSATERPGRCARAFGYPLRVKGLVYLGWSLLAICSALFAATPCAHSEEIHVPGEHATIQGAIDAAQGGDEIIDRMLSCDWGLGSERSDMGASGGNTSVSIPPELLPLPRAAGVQIRSVHPNPFNPRTQVDFVLDRLLPVEFGVYDLGGRLVRRLWEGELRAGEHRLVWDGRTDQHRGVPSGVYTIHLRWPGGAGHRQALLPK